MKKFLLLGVILVLFLLPFSVSADDFDLEVSIIRDIGNYNVTELSSGVYYSESFFLNRANSIITIPKNQSLPNGIELMGSRFSFGSWDGESTQYKRYQDSSAYYVLQKIALGGSQKVRFWSWGSRTATTQIIVKGSGFLSSDRFAFGWQYHFVPVTDSLLPLQGNYDIHLTSEYPYSALILYSVEPLSDFGDLSDYYVSTSDIDLPVTTADRLYYNVSEGEITLDPDYYNINLPTIGYSYLFRNVPVGDYHISSGFTWQRFDPSSYVTGQLVFPYVYYYDDTQGQAQQAVLDVWERYEDGDISSKQAIDQLDTLIQIMIETSDSDQEKTYWITYQKTIVDRIQSEESDRRRRADVESALSGFEEALESKDQSSGNRLVDQLTGVFDNALPTASYTSLLSPLVSAISYSGVGGGFTFPAITIPKLSFTDQEYTLNDEIYVDFGEYVELFPEPLLIVVRCLIVIGLYIWAFFEMKDLIFQAFSGGDKG